MFITACVSLSYEFCHMECIPLYLHLPLNPDMFNQLAGANTCHNKGFTYQRLLRRKKIIEGLFTF